MKEKLVEVKYFRNGRVSHVSKQIWVETEKYCPHCGTRSVWLDDGGGDFEAGDDYLCTSCGHGFTCFRFTDENQDEQGKQILEALKIVEDLS